MNIKEYLASYQNLLDRDFSDPSTSLGEVLMTWTKLKESFSEYLAHAYIEYTCDTQNPEKTAAYTKAIEEIELLSPLRHQMQEKILSAFKNPPKEFQYAYRLLENDVVLFRKENIPLETEVSKLSQEYQAIIGKLSIEHEGEVLPISMAKPLLEKTHRPLREEVFTKICHSYQSVASKIDEIFQKQVKLRDTIAKNANFPNYRDYVHTAKARFDYTPKDCITFSESIKSVVVPHSRNIYEGKKQKLGLTALSPFDTGVDPLGRPPLKPASSPEEFLTKSIDVLSAVSPDVGETLRKLQAHKQLDLFSRQGKAPGGYNYPLPVSKTSFIFMNCAFIHQDAVTLFHEAGHAYHFDVYKNHEDPFLYKHPSSEIAELASMSMELMSMEHWDILYPNKEELRRAKRQQLEGIINFFPWMAIVDSFQQWIYLSPKASIEERNEHFVSLYKQYLPAISWDGFEQFLPYFWHKQLHIIELPFYYVEYGIAQLGAIQIWKWYKENPSMGLERYQKALSFASKGPISEAYKKAGISIAFTPEYIRPLIEFLNKELLELQ